MLKIMKRNDGKYGIFNHKEFGIEDTWIEDEDGNELPTCFETKEEAQKTLNKVRNWN